MSIIIDISMPLCNTVDFEESGNGMTSGIAYLKSLLSRMEEGILVKTKCMVFSNVESPEIVDFCDSKSVPYYAKTRLLPDRFVNILIKYLSKKKKYKI